MKLSNINLSEVINIGFQQFINYIRVNEVEKKIGDGLREKGYSIDKVPKNHTKKSENKGFDYVTKKEGIWKIQL